jgi:hypothetical protein
MVDYVSLTIQMTQEQRQRIEEQAKERGYDVLDDYLLALVEADADDDFIDDPEEDAIDLEADFREAWAAAMTGNVRPVEELFDEIRRELGQDANES